MATAARGGANDLTSGPIARTLLMFSLPTLGSNILQSLNGSINAVWVGRFIGENGIAATSNANLIMFLMFALGFGFGMAAVIMIGQSMGARDLAGARRAFGGAIGLFAFISVAVALLGFATTGALLHVLATPAEASEMAHAYLRVIFLALPPMFMTMLLTMGLRAIGDSLTPLRFMIVNVLLDAGLNPVLILGLGPAPRLGIGGSAMATLIANYTVMIGLFVHIYLKDVPLRLKGPELRYLLPDAALLRLILAKGVPMGLQMLVMTFSGLIMVGLVNRAGVLTAAAYGVIQQLWAYLQMPAMAIGVGVSAMAAQSVGARKRERLGPITRAGVIINLMLTGAGIILLLLFDRPVMALFLGGESPAIPLAQHIQLIANWSFLTFGVTLVLFATVRSTGAVLPPLLILSVGLLGVRCTLAALFDNRYGAAAVWWSFPISSVVTMTMAIAYYRFGGWRERTMMVPPAPAQVEEQSKADCEPTGRMQPTD